MSFDLQIKFGGEAGYGIMVTGLTFSKTCLRHGFFVFDYIEYPSLIRGGHNTYQVRIRNQPEVFSQKQSVDLLVALDKETMDLHKDELTKDAYLVFDPDEIDIAECKISNAKYQMIAVPIGKILGDLSAPKVVRNSVALGAVCALLDLNLKILKGVLADVFEDKGVKIVEINQKAAQVGFEYIRKNNAVAARPWRAFQLAPLSGGAANNSGGLLTGNEAVALGAIASGCQAYFAYPMTPSSSILHFLALHGPTYNMVVTQPEDEISAINMAIGASFAGVRSMVGTSGGGFCLMTEGLGLAGMTETPLIIVVSQRPGPATGLPTWTEQGDLRFVIHAHQGDFPRIVLAPGDVEETLSLTQKAFNLADRYQLPVILLLDKYLSESHKSVEWIQDTGYRIQGGGKVNGIDRGEILEWEELEKMEDYKRYQFTDSGVSPRSLPGQERGVFRANSDEHDEDGFSEEGAENRVKMMDKRMGKLKMASEEIGGVKFYGVEDARVTLIGWGSTKGPVLEALNFFNTQKSSIKVNFLHLTQLWPFPKEQVAKALFMTKRSIILEGNYSGQLHSLIKEQIGRSCDEEFFKYDGRPFYPEEIAEKVLA